MYPLFETIKILNGVPQHLEWHQKRMNESFNRYFNSEDVPVLQEKIKVPGKYSSGIMKCRFHYSKAKHLPEYSAYTSRKISSLKIVNGDHIEYSMKYTDRSALTQLTTLKDTCDEILIVKDNMITDTSFSNIVFRDGDEWLTPRYPLLKGTCRSRLLDEGRIKEAEILLSDLSKFDSFVLINAMNDLNDSDGLSVEQIRS